MEVYTGENQPTSMADVWLPAETLDLIRDYRVAIKGLTTPVGGGIRSLNVALRRKLDLYVCLRPVRYCRAPRGPVKHLELTDMVIFRETQKISMPVSSGKPICGSRQSDQIPAR